MEPFQQRVVEEKKELDSKIVSLVIFISDINQFTELNEEEKERLKCQRNIMIAYSDVLAERIDNFRF